MSLSIKPMTTLNAAFAAPKMARSLSVSSSTSSGSASSTYSRTADDMLDRLAAQEGATTFSIWSAGNLRLHGRDLTLPSRDASELLTSLKMDGRFEIMSIHYLDGEEEEWKASVRRIIASPDSPTVLSDIE